MSTNYKYILPNYISQVPDSVDNTFGQQDTSSSFVFGAQPQTLMTVESADTINEVISVPQTIRNEVYVVKEVVVEKEDTLKYFTEYLYQLTQLKLDNNSLPLLTEEYSVKPDVSVKYKDVITKRTELAKEKKVSKNTLVTETSKNLKANNSKQKNINTITIKEENTNNNIADFKPNNWIVGIVILSAFIFAWVRLFYYKNYRIILKSGYNYNNSVKFFKEANSSSQRISFFLNIIFILNVSIFLYLMFGYLKVSIPINDFKLILFLFASITGIYSIKYLVIKTIGFIFSSDSAASEYISNIWLYNKLLGMSLFPVIIALPYINLPMKTPLLYSGIFLLFIFFIFRLIRSFQIVFKIKLSIIYWFLYLCTLEILPVFVLSKIINI